MNLSLCARLVLCSCSLLVHILGYIAITQTLTLKVVQRLRADSEQDNNEGTFFNLFTKLLAIVVTLNLPLYAIAFHFETRQMGI